MPPMWLSSQTIILEENHCTLASSMYWKSGLTRGGRFLRQLQLKKTAEGCKMNQMQPDLVQPYRGMFLFGSPIRAQFTYLAHWFIPRVQNRTLIMVSATKYLGINKYIHPLRKMQSMQILFEHQNHDLGQLGSPKFKSFCFYCP